MHFKTPAVCLGAFCVVISGCASSSHRPISLSVAPQPAYVGSGQSVQLTANLVNSTKGVTWAITGAVTGVAGGSVSVQGLFSAPTVSQNASVTVTATSVEKPAVSASTTVNIIASGTVVSTANPQVALYTISVPDGLSAFVQFSSDTSYKLFTWSVAAASRGGAVPILVAGMKGNTPYHMRAVFQPTGTTSSVFTDVDHVFTTSAYDPASLPMLTTSSATSTAAGQVAQSGVELLDLIGTVPPGTTQLHTVVTDLAGNILWAYSPGASVVAGVSVDPIKLLPNGHFLILYSSPAPDGANSVVQEVDLTGNIIWQMTSAQLNAALAAATCTGCNITVLGVHHDFAIMPNGHLIFLGATQEVVSGTTVTGDVVIDLDQNHNPVWFWNAFDHLDVNRHPMGYPDWTHSNAIVYSPDDKSLMVSSRHQSWVFKINYNDGAGDGSILWRLGYQGDFALQSGTYNSVDPEDWFSAQHDANIISPTTAGALDILMFDNGNQRLIDSSGTICGITVPCKSRVPIIHIDEIAKTADITWLDKLDPISSFFGGSARLLKNGNVEFDECAITTPANNAAVYEVTKTNPPAVVWQMQVAGQYAYRAIRMPSLYPGVQW